MFDKYCEDYMFMVLHRSNWDWEMVVPSGKAFDDLVHDDVKRKTVKEFKEKYCSNCKTIECQINKLVNVNLDPYNIGVKQPIILVDPATQEKTCCNPITKETVKTPVYFDTPTKFIDISSVIGKVKGPEPEDVLYCQGLVIDMDGYYTSLLYFDMRDCPDYINDCIDYNIYMNIGGEVVGYGYFTGIPVEDTDTEMITVSWGKINFDDAVYRTKAAFKRIAEEIFGL